MIKFEKIHARDWIALIILGGAFYLKLKGLDGTLNTIIALIVGYYFSKRVYEENGNKTHSS